jgi:hypothetical protein
MFGIQKKPFALAILVTVNVPGSVVCSDETFSSSCGRDAAPHLRFRIRAPRSSPFLFDYRSQKWPSMQNRPNSIKEKKKIPKHGANSVVE